VQVSAVGRTWAVRWQKIERDLAGFAC
jgi:hypothetical protein